MITDQRYVLGEYWNLNEYPTFRQYLDAQTPTLVIFLQEAADNHWTLLRWRMEGASDEEIGEEMQRWWNGQIRCFHARLRHEWEHVWRRRLRRRAERAERRQAEAEEEVAKLRAELHEAKVDLEIERGLYANLKDQFYCRDCYGKRWGGN